MNLYSSKTPRDLNHDPEPWVCPVMRHPLPCAPTNDKRFEVCRDPRPEFDYVQHNPPNYLLVEFREFSGIPDLWVSALSDPVFIYETAAAYRTTITREHIIHAVKVLERLARLSA